MGGPLAASRLLIGQCKLPWTPFPRIDSQTSGLPSNKCVEGKADMPAADGRSRGASNNRPAQMPLVYVQCKHASRNVSGKHALGNAVPQSPRATQHSYLCGRDKHSRSELRRSGAGIYCGWAGDQAGDRHGGYPLQRSSTEELCRGATACTGAGWLLPFWAGSSQGTCRGRTTKAGALAAACKGGPTGKSGTGTLHYTITSCLDKNAATHCAEHSSGR